MFKHKIIPVFFLLLLVFGIDAGKQVTNKDNQSIKISSNHRRLSTPPSLDSIVRNGGETYALAKDIYPGGNNTLYIATRGDVILKYDDQYNEITRWGGKGTADGKFQECVDIAVDRDNNVYVVERDNNRAQKFDDVNPPNHLGSLFLDDDSAEYVKRVKVDCDGIIWILRPRGETGSDIFKFTNEGIEISSLSFEEWLGDFEFDSDNNVHMSSPTYNRINKYDSDFNFLRSYGGEGIMNWPVVIAIDCNGLLYVSERDGKKVSIWTKEGNQYETPYISTDFKVPYAIYIDGAYAYIGDNGADQVQKWNLNNGCSNKGPGQLKINCNSGNSITSFDHWNIHFIDSSIVEDDGPLIRLQYNASDREISTQVVQKDCKTNFEGVSENSISFTDSRSIPSDEFVLYNISIEIDHTGFIHNNSYWTNITDTSGFMEVCVVTTLYLDPGHIEIVNFLESLINVTYDTDGNFEVSNINASRTDAEESQVNVDYSTYLSAYQCRTNDLTEKVDLEYNQGSLLVVCVTGDGATVDVDEITQLSVYQGESNSFEYISSQGQFNAAIVDTNCETVASIPICYAQLRLLGRFFASNTPEQLRLSGSVSMTFPNSRRLFQSAFLPEKYHDVKDSRYLQDTSESGTFNVLARLGKVEDSKNSQSILSGETNYFNLSLSLYFFGIVWCIM